MAATFGVIVADQILMWTAVAGVAAVLTAWPVAFGAIQWLGAVYLAWIGFRMITRRRAMRRFSTSGHDDTFSKRW